tara:strand:- start:70 stop:1140 length:1071 start_codon:yes stop_codon:yes gene_type:complete
MKIAVFLVGQWRGTSYDCSKYLKKIFEDYDTDYYIHTWESFSGKTINNNTEDSILDFDDYIHTSDDIEKIRNSYPNVVSMQVGSTKSMNSISQHCESTDLSSFPQFYCAYEANKARMVYENMNGFHYDVIVKLRPDIIFGPDAIEGFKKNIEYVKLNPLAIYSHYHTTKENLIPNVNLVWDYYTISSPFGMDCMMEWVDDVMNNDDINQSFSSNYIIKHELIPNPIPIKFSQRGDHPTPTIMRELFKYNNLVDLFYENENNPARLLPYIHFLYDYLYRNCGGKLKYDGWFDWISFDGVESKEDSNIYKESELKNLANLIVEKYESEKNRYESIISKELHGMIKSEDKDEYIKRITE